MRNKLVLQCVGVLSAFALAAVFVFRPLPTAITRENAALLKAGMKVADVESILGEPRNEAILPSELSVEGPLIPFSREYRRRWVGESVVITVHSFQPGRSPEIVTAIDVTNHEFASGWDFVRWRVLRVLGLAPNRPLPVDAMGSDPIIEIL